ncbi:MAG TPA: AraC family transcriptional regulator [Pseudonocardia sp.]|jgi:AraC-like DNA-binding protein
MTTALSETEPTGRVEFHSTNAARAIDYLQTAYGAGLRVSGARDGQLVAHSRLDGGSFAIDDLRLPLNLQVGQDPLGSLIVVTPRAGQFERECGGITERFRAGDVFVDAEPTLPSTLQLRDAEVQTVMLDLAVLAQIAATSATRTPGPVRLTSYQPTSPTAVAHWKRTINYLHQLLGNGAAATLPLIRANAAQLLAAAVLTTFPNTAVTDPTAQDRHDATGATARRAREFIEQNAHTQICLADIAAAANVGIRAVQLAFRRHFDTTPLAYLRAIRLDHAHHDLQTGDPSRGDTVTTIANRWGFTNHNRFTTQYRHTYGVTPRHTLHS